MAFDFSDIDSLDAPGLLAQIRSSSDKEIAEAFGGEHRARLLHGIFGAFPLAFRPEKAGDRSARIDFRITGGPDDSSDTYAVVVREGTCVTEKSPSGEPDLSLMMGPVEFLKLITGRGNPAMMFMMGKIKARGDLGLASGLANWFSMPA